MAKVSEGTETMIEQEQLACRFMTTEDLERVMEIERDAFSHPWDLSIFRYELMENKFAHYLVYEYRGLIIGFCGLWIIMGDAQITNIAIHSDYRGYGLGEGLLHSAFAYLQQFQVETLSLEVRRSNIVAQSLYRKMGFQEGGIRKNYYADNGEDALVMWVNLNEST